MKIKATLRRWLRDHDSYGADAEKRFATAAGLRQLADLIEDHPEAVLPSSYTISVWDSTYAQDHDKAIEHLRGKAKLLGGKWEKRVTGGSFTLTRKLGGLVEYQLAAPREAICAKRVIGTQRVERPKMPDPSISYETEIVEEDVVEWDCPTVLA